MWQSWMGWKMPLCKWHTFWMTPCLICHFIVILFYIERKWLFMRNVAIIVPLKSKSSGKFQRFNTNDEIIEPSTPSPPTPSDKILLRLWNKNFLRKIYINIQTFAFKVLQECSSWVSGRDAVQMFFLITNRKVFAGKFVKCEKFLVVYWQIIIFNVKWVEVRKMSEGFWAKLYFKMSGLFR